uniref:Anaphase-promoting complex subunit 1 n=1 Tax=Macrostomum lignano TaxID=282301 RepID=A0A1I8GCE0_9PLAT
RPLTEYLDGLAIRLGAVGACGCYLGQEPKAHAVLLYGLASLPSNALMACQPGHEFMLYLLRKLPLYLAWHESSQGSEAERLRRRQGFHASRLTGPVMLHRLLRQYQRQPPCNWQLAKCRVCLMEPEYTMPYTDPSQLSRMRELCDTVAKQPVRVPLVRRARVAEFCSEHLEDILLKSASSADRTSETDNWVVAEHDFLHLAYTTLDADSSDSILSSSRTTDGASSEQRQWLNLTRLMSQFPGRIDVRL